MIPLGRVIGAALVCAALALSSLCCGGEGGPTYPVRANGVWSPDGSRILLVSQRDGNKEIYVVGADGRGLVRLTNDPQADDSPAWSPDGTRIAFSTFRGGLAREIWTMNADGAAAHRLGALVGTQPAWSPDGTRIAYVSGGIRTASAVDGSGDALVPGSHGTDSDPAWSPDGTRIAFASFRNGASWQIWAINADGTGATQLTTEASAPSSPSWTPDGARVCYVSSLAYSVQPDGTGRTQVTEHQAYDYALSPDGRRATYVRWMPSPTPDSDTDVFVAAPDGTAETNITDDPGLDWLH